MYSEVEAQLTGRSILLMVDFNATSGGTRTYFFSLLNYYSRRKTKLNVILKQELLDEEVVKAGKKADVNWLPVKDWPFTVYLERYPFNIILKVLDHFLYSRIVRKIKPDLILISCNLPGKLISLLSLSYPLVYVVHTLPQGAHKFSLKRLMCKFFLRRNKHMLTVSKYATQQITTHWLDQSVNLNLHYIYNAPNNIFKIENEGVVVTKAEIIVLTMGNVVNYKNPFIWIETAKQVVKKHPNVNFIWGGDGPLIEECKNRVKDYANIIFVGNIRDTSGFYKTASIYFHPSLEESHGISVVEAMSYKLPCVVSSIGGLMESVEHEKTGLLAYTNTVDEFSKYLLRLIDSREERRRMGLRGFERYCALFSDQRWSEQMDNLHHKILKYV